MVCDLVVVRGILRGICALRIVLTGLINLSGGQLLKRNRSRNRLGHIVVDSDLDLDAAVNEVARVAFGSKGHRTGTQELVLILLIDELCVQRVALTRNQVGVGHSIDNYRAHLNLRSAILELSLSLDRRLRVFNHESLCLIAGLFVRDYLAVIHLRIVGLASIIGGRIALAVKWDRLLVHNIRRARVQPLNLAEIDDSLARAVLGSGDINRLHFADRLYRLAINLLQLTLKPVLHTRYQVFVGDGVLNVQTTDGILRLNGHRSVLRRLLAVDRNLGSDLAIRVGRNRLEGLIDGDDLCGVVRVRVVSNELFSPEVVEVKTLEYNGVAVFDLVSSGDFHDNGAGNRAGDRTFSPSLVRCDGGGSFPVRRVRVRTAHQLSLQGVFNTRNKAIQVHLVVDRGCRRSSRDTVRIEGILLQGSARTDPRCKSRGFLVDGNGLGIIVQVAVLRDLHLVIRRNKLALFLLRRGIQRLEDHCFFTGIQRFLTRYRNRNPARVTGSVIALLVAQIFDSKFRTRHLFTQRFTGGFAHELSGYRVGDARSQLGEVHLVVDVCGCVFALWDFDIIDSIAIEFAVDERRGGSHCRRHEAVIGEQLLGFEILTVVRCVIFVPISRRVVFFVDVATLETLANVAEFAFFNLVGVIEIHFDGSSNSAVRIVPSLDEVLTFVVAQSLDLAVVLHDERDVVVIQLFVLETLKVARRPLKGPQSVPARGKVLNRDYVVAVFWRLPHGVLHHTVFVERCLRTDPNFVLRLRRNGRRRLLSGRRCCLLSATGRLCRGSRRGRLRRRHLACRRRCGFLFGGRENNHVLLAISVVRHKGPTANPTKSIVGDTNVRRPREVVVKSLHISTVLPAPLRALKIRIDSVGVILHCSLSCRYCLSGV